MCLCMLYMQTTILAKGEWIYCVIYELTTLNKSIIVYLLRSSLSVGSCTTISVHAKFFSAQIIIKVLPADALHK